MPASDISDSRSGFQFTFNSGKRWDPRCSQVGGVPRTEETFRADKEIGMMFTPEHAASAAKVVFNSFHSLSHGFNDIKAAAYIERAVLISQCDGLLGRKTVVTIFGIVINVAACGLIY